jgi:hypothetical protein
VKLFTSEQPASLSQVLRAFSRVASQPARLVCGVHTASRQQPRRLHFRSIIWRELGTPCSVSLLSGISRIYQHYLALYQQGRLPPL